MWSFRCSAKKIYGTGITVEIEKFKFGKEKYKGFHFVKNTWPWFIKNII